MELRERVVRSYEAGEGSHAEIGERFAVGEATVKRWVRLKRTRGDVLPSPKGGGTPSEIRGEQIAAMLARLGDPTAVELTAEFNRSRGRRRARIHVSSMKRALHRHGYVVKKSADGRWRVFVPTSLNAEPPSSGKSAACPLSASSSSTNPGSAWR
jgi:transposase